MQAVESLEVEIAAVHDVEGARLGNEHIEDVDVVQFAVGEMDETRDSPVQVEQRVQLHGCFGCAELGPREQRQAQVDGGGIQCIDRLGEIHRKGFLSIQAPGDADESVSELGKDAPVARLVGVGEGSPWYSQAPAFQRSPGSPAAGPPSISSKHFYTKTT